MNVFKLYKKDFINKYRGMLTHYIRALYNQFSEKTKIYKKNNSIS